jgi:hypothetical protein
MLVFIYFLTLRCCVFKYLGNSTFFIKFDLTFSVPSKRKIFSALAQLVAIANTDKYAVDI